MKDTERIPNVVVIGGGTGMPVLLRGLKEYPVHITAIVTVADDGGSSGRLRNELLIPPPGDVRNCLAALAEVEPLVESLFQHRFTDGVGLSGHSLGNLLLAAMTNITGDFVNGIRELSRVLNVKGDVLPAANQSIILNAEMEDGTIVTGESKIPTLNKRIKRVFLTPEDAEPPEATLQAIENADLILMGPGSLYTSILPNLLVKQIIDAISFSKAETVYVCNVMTQPGETTGFKASDHVKALYDHIREPMIQTVIVNNADIPEEIKKRYAAQNAEPVENDAQTLKQLGYRVMEENIIQYDQDVVRHDAYKLAGVIFDLLKK